MAKSETEKQKRAQRTREFLGQLAERYPQCFTRDADKVRPLAIGMQQQLRDELGKDEAWKDTPNWLIRQALALYTRSGAYFNAIVEKRPRINLDGSDAGEVTDEQQGHAQTQLDELKKRRAERRAQQPERPRRPRRAEGQPKAKKPRQGQQRKPRDKEKQEPQPQLTTQQKLELLARKFAKD